jgi:hypothetical protein
MALILSGDTGVPASGMPTGSVIQTVSSTTTTNSSSSGTSWVVATNFGATITPQFSNSKIAIFMCGGMCDNGVSGSQVSLSIYRNNTTNLAPGAGGNDRGITEVYSASSRVQIPISVSYVDSPATTSATTYTLYFKPNGAGTAQINTDNNQGCIILQEIKQ